MRSNEKSSACPFPQRSKSKMSAVSFSILTVKKKKKKLNMKGTPSHFLWILLSFGWTCCQLEKHFLCKLFPQLCESSKSRSDSPHFFPTLNLTIIFTKPQSNLSGAVGSKKPAKGNIEIVMIKTASFKWHIKLKLLFECVSLPGLEETGKKKQVLSCFHGMCNM